MGPPDDGAGERADEDPSVDASENAPPRYMFPVDGDHSSAVLAIVCDLVAEADAGLVIASPVTVPEQTPLESPGPRAQGRRRAADLALEAKQRCHSDPSLEQVVRIGHGREHIIRDIVETYSISTLITEDRPRSGIRSLLGIERVEEAATHGCDTIIVARIEHLETIESVVVPIARGPHSGMAIDTGLALARQNQASLELLHVSDGSEDGRAEGERVLEKGIERTGDDERVDRTLLEADEVPRAVIEYTHPFDVTVLGAPREGLLRQFILGTIPDEVSTRGDGTVLIAHRDGVDESRLDRWI